MANDGRKKNFDERSVRSFYSTERREEGEIGWRE
jgi:hypothetical protein